MCMTDEEKRADTIARAVMEYEMDNRIKIEKEEVPRLPLWMGWDFGTEEGVCVVYNMDGTFYIEEEE